MEDARSRAARARSCTRCAAARWRRWARYRSASTTAAVDATPLFVVLAGTLRAAHGRLVVHRRALAGNRAGADLDRRAGRLDGDGFVEYARGGRDGTLQPGLEGLPRRGLPRRRQTGGGPDRAGRGAGLRLCRQATCRRDVRASWAWRNAPPPSSGRPSSCKSASRKPSGARNRHSTRSRSTAARRPCRCAPAIAGHALATGIASPDRARRVADGADAIRASISGWGIRTVARGRGALQPDVLPQRVDLAARQRPHRARPGQVRPQARHQS